MPRARVSTFLILIFTVALCGCEKKVRLGVVLPLSGEHRIYGESSRKGLELALEELRTGGESRIELRVVDSESDPEKAREHLRRLYRDGVLAAIGGLRPAEARAMAPVAEDRERVLLSPSTSLRGQSPEARYFFSLGVADDVAGTTMASFVSRELGVGSAVLIGETDSEGLSEGFRSTLSTQGGELLASLPSSGMTGSVIEQALGHQPDAIFLAGEAAALETLIRELRARQFQGRILTTQALACTASLRRLGDDARGLLLTHSVFQPEAPSDRVTDFVARYRQKYDEEPDIFAAESYDALMVLATSIEGRPVLPSEVRKGLLHDVKDFQGVTGTLQFDENRGVAKIPRVYSITEELTLRDHGRWLQVERDRIARDREKILERLREIRESMAGHEPTENESDS